MCSCCAVVLLSKAVALFTYKSTPAPHVAIQLLRRENVCLTGAMVARLSPVGLRGRLVLDNVRHADHREQTSGAKRLREERLLGRDECDI